jgi:hypothetical protein
MLLVIAIVGTTVAPWQLFFQQSYVIDKRIGPRFINYERLDLIIGIAIVIFGAVAMIAFCAHAFAGTAEFGRFTDAAGVAQGLDRFHGSRLPGTLFALALIDASIIGAAAVSLSSAYALGDVFSMRHSLHESPGRAKMFYGIYCCLIVFAAALVLIPRMPLGLLTNAVQTLAGVLLPSASVFLLLLCNDRELLGPWANSFRLNVFTTLVVGVLVLLSLILTAAVLFPGISGAQVLGIFSAGTALGAVAAAAVAYRSRRAPASAFDSARPSVPRERPRVSSHFDRSGWRAPRLETLGPIQLTTARRIWMLVLRAYLVIAVVMVIVRVTQTA